MRKNRLRFNALPGPLAEHPIPTTLQDHTDVAIYVRQLENENAVLRENERRKDNAMASWVIDAQAKQIDERTGLIKYEYLPEFMDYVLHQTSKYGTPFGVVMADIDWFKLVNEAHGHFGGNRALAHVGETLKKQIRDYDLGFRYGGEELLFILRGCTNLKELVHITERMHRALETTPCDVNGDGSKLIPLTASFGLVICEQPTDWERVIDMADRYEGSAKHSGRNRIHLKIGDDSFEVSGNRIAPVVPLLAGKSAVHDQLVAG